MTSTIRIGTSDEYEIPSDKHLIVESEVGYILKVKVTDINEVLNILEQLKDALKIRERDYDMVMFEDPIHGFGDTIEVITDNINEVVDHYDDETYDKFVPELKEYGEYMKRMVDIKIDFVCKKKKCVDELNKLGFDYDFYITADQYNGWGNLNVDKHDWICRMYKSIIKDAIKAYGTNREPLTETYTGFDRESEGYRRDVKMWAYIK